MADQVSLSFDLGRALLSHVFQGGEMDAWFAGAGATLHANVGTSFTKTGDAPDAGRALVQPLGAGTPFAVYETSARSPFRYDVLVELHEVELPEQHVQGVMSILNAKLADFGDALYAVFAALTSPTPSTDLLGGGVEVTYAEPFVSYPVESDDGPLAGEDPDRPKIATTVEIIAWHKPLSVS